VTSLLVATLVTAAACGGAAAPPSASDVPAAVPDAGVDGAGAGLVIVLPAADLIDEAEAARLRLLVERALIGAVNGGRPVEVLVPMTDVTTPSLVEDSARGGAQVCVLGATAQASLDAVLGLYPALRACGIGPDRGTGVLRSDVDLQTIGQRLGRAARLAAGTGTVLVLAGQDAMLDERWRRGVTLGANGGPVVVVGRAEDVVPALEALAEGRFPAVPSLRGPGLDPDDADAAAPLPSELPPVGAVVLDASAGARAVALALLDREVPLVAPRSLVADASADASIVLRWRIMWDVFFVLLLRELVAGALLAQLDGWGADDTLVLEDGPARVLEPAAGPADRPGGG